MMLGELTSDLQVVGREREREREKKRERLGLVQSLESQIHSQQHTSFNNATLFNPSQIVPLTRNQTFKHASPRESILIQTTTLSFLFSFVFDTELQHVS